MGLRLLKADSPGPADAAAEGAPAAPLFFLADPMSVRMEGGLGLELGGGERPLSFLSLPPDAPGRLFFFPNIMLMALLCSGGGGLDSLVDIILMVYNYYRDT